MKLVSQLCSHPAWQPQFRELQKSQEPCEAAVKAALHGSINILTKCAGMRLCASLLPEHVSKAITECFLKSEVSLCSLTMIGTFLCCSPTGGKGFNVVIFVTVLPSTVAMSYVSGLSSVTVSIGHPVVCSGNIPYSL